MKKLTCSRLSHKNDNRLVEQKNATLMRQYCGTLRLDTSEQGAAMNVLYEKMWPDSNLFQPVLHLKRNRWNLMAWCANGILPKRLINACWQAGS